MYGINFIPKHKPTKTGLNQAQSFYDEFLEYSDNKEVAEEYELVQHWAEDLKLDKNFELVGEIQYRRRSNLDEFIESIENDPLGLDERDPIKERKENIFQDWQENKKDADMAIVYYMVSSLQYFEKLSAREVKKIAYDIALQGTQVYSPSKDGYEINSIPDKEFTGKQILAWLYVSWAIAMPDDVDSLGLSFQEEYKLAQELFRKN